MFSGNGDRDNVLKAVELGARGFVGMPFTQEILAQDIAGSYAQVKAGLDARQAAALS